jgi:hypothetical protein
MTGAFSGTFVQMSSKQTDANLESIYILFLSIKPKDEMYCSMGIPIR